MPQIDLATFRDQIIYSLIAFSTLYIVIAYFVLPHIQAKVEMKKKLVQRYLTNSDKNQAKDLVSKFYKILLKRK